jgi:cold shock CspA family protein
MQLCMVPSLHQVSHLHSAPLPGALRRGVLLLLERAHDVGPIQVREAKRRSADAERNNQEAGRRSWLCFVAANDGKEYFFHRSGTEVDFDSLMGGEAVTFEIEASPKGPRAGRVRLAQATSTS